MYLSSRTIHMILLFLSFVVFSFSLIRPLFSYFVYRNVWTLWERELAWSISKKRWRKSYASLKIKRRMIVFVVFFFVTLALAAFKVHVSYLIFFLALSMFFGFLWIEAYIPPKYAITAKGIIIRAPDTLVLLRGGFRVESFFVSWKRVKDVQLKNGAVSLLVAVGKGKPHPLLDRYIFAHRQILIYLPQKRREKILTSIQNHTQTSRKILRDPV